MTPDPHFDKAESGISLPANEHLTFFLPMIDTDDIQRDKPN